MCCLTVSSGRAYEVINTPDREPGTYLVADVELRQIGETLTCQTE